MQKNLFGTERGRAVKLVNLATGGHKNLSLGGLPGEKHWFKSGAYTIFGGGGYFILFFTLKSLREACLHRTKYIWNGTRF